MDDLNTHTKPAETQPRDSFIIPLSLRYFEYDLGCAARTHTINDASVIRPFLDSCTAMGVQLLASRVHDIFDNVSIPVVLFKYYLPI